jgi:hypothetical protein
MMIFLTMLFIGISIQGVLNGGRFSESRKKYLNLKLREEQSKQGMNVSFNNVEDEKIKITTGFIAILLILEMLVRIIYLLYAFDIDIYKYPTMFVLAYLTCWKLVNFSIENIKNKKLDETYKYNKLIEEQERVKIIPRIRSMAYMAYYIYILKMIVIGI